MSSLIVLESATTVSGNVTQTNWLDLADPDQSGWFLDRALAFLEIQGTNGITGGSVVVKLQHAISPDAGLFVDVNQGDFSPLGPSSAGALAVEVDSLARFLRWTATATGLAGSISFGIRLMPLRYNATPKVLQQTLQRSIAGSGVLG